MISESNKYDFPELLIIINFFNTTLVNMVKLFIDISP